MYITYRLLYFSAKDLKVLITKAVSYMYKLTMPMTHEEQTWGKKMLFLHRLVPKACSAVPIIAHFPPSASSIFNL